MEEKYNHQAQGYPLASPSMPRSDQEYTTTNYQPSQTLGKSKKIRLRRLAYLAFVASTLVTLVLVITLVFFRATTPRARLADVELSENATGGGLRLAGRVSVSNRNFARYEFESSLATIRAVDGTYAGRFVIHDGQVRARSTARVYVVADLSRPSTVNGLSDYRVESRLKGRVRILRVFRRNRLTVLNCTMTVDLTTNGVRNLRCY